MKIRFHPGTTFPVVIDFGNGHIQKFTEKASIELEKNLGACNKIMRDSSKTSNQNQQELNDKSSGLMESQYVTPKVPDAPTALRDSPVDNPQDDSGVVSRTAKEGSVLSTFPADSNLAYKRAKEALSRLRKRN